MVPGIASKHPRSNTAPKSSTVAAFIVLLKKGGDVVPRAEKIIIDVVRYKVRCRKR